MRPVEVAKRRVAKWSENTRVDGGDAPNGNVPFGLFGFISALRKKMANKHMPPRCRGRSDCLDAGSRGGVVGSQILAVKIAPHHLGAGKGHEMKGDRAVGIGQIDAFDAVS